MIYRLPPKARIFLITMLWSLIFLTIYLHKICVYFSDLSSHKFSRPVYIEYPWKYYKLASWYCHHIAIFKTELKSRTIHDRLTSNGTMFITNFANIGHLLSVILMNRIVLQTISASIRSLCRNSAPLEPARGILEWLETEQQKTLKLNHKYPK